MNDDSLTFIDTHCHLDFSEMGDIDVVLKESQSAGINQFVIPSVDANNWQRVLALSSKYASIDSALGIHPYFLSDDNRLSQLTMLATAQRENIVAIGEIGLDGSIDWPQALQIEVLKFQLSLAKSLDLPVICHGHKAVDVLLKYLRVYQLPKGGVIHGFSGSLSQAKEFLKLGFYLGVGGVITYERAQKTRRMFSQLPLDVMLLETDSPDMPVSGFQGQNNHPKHIPQIAKQLSELVDKPLALVAQTTWDNAKQLFEI